MQSQMQNSIGESTFSHMSDCRLRSRRQFLFRLTMIAAWSSSGLSPGQTGLATAAASAVSESRTQRFLATMARQLYPHSTLPDARYAAIAIAFIAKTADDAAATQLLNTGMASLDDQSNGDWLAASAATQLACLVALESSAFFQAVRVHTMLHLYRDAEIWTRFGYGGDAWRVGGYIGRLNDIDWLPDPKTTL